MKKTSAKAKTHEPTWMLAPGAAARDKMMAVELDHLVEQAKGKFVPHPKAKRQLGL